MLPVEAGPPLLVLAAFVRRQANPPDGTMLQVAGAPPACLVPLRRMATKTALTRHLPPAEWAAATRITDNVPVHGFCVKKAPAKTMPDRRSRPGIDMPIAS